MKKWCESFFKLSEHNTSVWTEIIAGITTFVTMAYIIFVQPAVLSGSMFGMTTGMDWGSVMVATCISASLSTLIMGLYVNYPIALAPGMGENFFFVFTLIPAIAGLGISNPWQVALGVVFIAGIACLILTLFNNMRESIIYSISPSLKNSIAAAIGIFIAFIGLQNAHIIVANPGTLVQLTHNLMSKEIGIFLFGFIITSILFVRRVRGSILIGIMASAAFAWYLGAITYNGIISMPPSLAPTFFQMDIIGALHIALVPFIVIFFFMDFFDPIGTLVGISEQGKLYKGQHLPKATRALITDAIGSVLGACIGTSTITSYIESATGIAEGGRTGLTAIIVALLFLAALFFSPLVAVIAGYPPITAPALVIVGAMMVQNASKIDWADYSEAIPSFLIIIGIPLTYSISDGLAFGFISYPIIKCLSGRGKDVYWLTYVMALLFIARYMYGAVVK